MTGNPWPLQRDCDAFYGNPRGRFIVHADPKWESENLIFTSLPFTMQFGGKPVTKIRIHKKCATSLRRVFNAMMAAYGTQEALDEAGVTEFDGSYTYRVMRGGSHLSMHAYGCAIDINAPRNPFRSRKFLFQPDSPIVKCFEAEGWTWGGRWKGGPDAMHFQGARVS